MISFTVRMRFVAEDLEDVRAMLTSLTHASRLEPGCVSYVPHFVDADATTVLIYEQYVNEAAVEAHKQTPHFKEFAIGGLYQRMRERSMEQLVAVA